MERSVFFNTLVENRRSTKRPKTSSVQPRDRAGTSPAVLPFIQIAGNG